MLGPNEHGTGNPCAAISKVLCARCRWSLNAEGFFFPGNLLGFRTNPVRQMEAMVHLQLAPPDSRHKADDSM